MRITLVLAAYIIGVCHASSSENSGIFGGTIDGNELIKLGRKLHKPMLTMIGMAIQNIQPQPCGIWTPWTPCDATGRGYFGSQTRNRSCRSNGDSDENGISSEVDSRLCEGDSRFDAVVEEFCPGTYNLTSNGFCLKLNETIVTTYEAVKQCESEGGFLMHIDSQQKHDDVKDLLGNFGDNIHIDGWRKTVWSPWEYKYGSQTTFPIWRPGYPSNNKQDRLCLALGTRAKLQYNDICGLGLPFMCEIVKQ